jgi:hypothetical protein
MGKQPEEWTEEARHFFARLQSEAGAARMPPEASLGEAVAVGKLLLAARAREMN